MANTSRPPRSPGPGGSSPRGSALYKGRRHKGKQSASAAGTRALAARVVTAVLQGRSLDAELEQRQVGLSDNDQRFLQALCYGVLRELRLLQWLSQQLMEKTPRKSGELIEALLCVGLFQLRSLSQPERASVHSTVEAARELKLDWAANLVNAVLRRYLRERETLDASIPDRPSIRLAHPGWLVKEIQQDWPEDWQALLEANNQPGPMWLRVNQARQQRDSYLVALGEADIEATASDYAANALCLSKALPVIALPGFEAGDVSVQDAAAQLAAPLLDCKAGMKVLDACAAPGGKAAHLLELEPTLKLLALDSDGNRLTRVDENFERLQLSGQSKAADAQDIQSWWDGEAFDRILLDAPCSGTGVIRRHPDIKWLRRASDIPALAARQSELLEALWPTLAPGGKLLFATCSVLRAEGDAVIEAFLPNHPDAQIENISANWGEATTHGRRIRSGDQAMDGFYYSLLTKRLNAVA